MNKMTYLAASLCSMPFAAFAGGMDQPVMEAPVVADAAPVMVSPNGDWNGAYVGGTLGFGNITSPTTAREGILGINLGYRRDFGKLVLGGELGYSKNDLGANSADDQINSTTTGQLMLGADLGRTLVYVAGGVSRAEATLGGLTASDTGYFGGLGVDYALSDRWTVGGEITSSLYKDFNNSGSDLKDTSVLFKVGMRF